METKPLYDLHGKVALVTGGGRGIGRACSLALARQGADVAVVAWGHPENADATVDEIRRAGGRAEVIVGDVADAASAAAMVRRAASDLGRLDVLVNNAGIVTTSSFVEMPEAEWDTVLAVDLKGQFLVGQAAARQMIHDHRPGRIVNVASIGSGGVGVGFPGAAHYVAAKGGVVALTETMALELAPMGITVNAVAPGVIDTDMTAPMLRDDATRRHMLGRVPLARAGRPEEVAALVVFLASDEASYCTGATYYVDGGWLAG